MPAAGVCKADALPKAVLFKQLLARENQLELDKDFVPKLTALTRDRCGGDGCSTCTVDGLPAGGCNSRR